MALFGKAWRGVKEFVRDIRIDADFPRFEREQRVAHEALAARRFDVSPLEGEIAAIQRRAQAEGHAAFADQIRLTESSIESLRPTIATLRQQLDVFSRDYRQELDHLHVEKHQLMQTRQTLFAQMKQLQAERSEAQQALGAAYADLESAKSLIDHWYAKSERTPWLLGNGGKKLPRRALFGQSFGDLEGYKADRARACEDIGDCKSTIAAIAAQQKANKSLRDTNKTGLDRVTADIQEVKAARQRLFELRDQGLRRHQVERALSEHLRTESRLQEDRRLLEQALSELVEQQSCRMGIEERRHALAELRSKRVRFLAEFDEPHQQSARRQAHRQAWLRQRETA